jgi:hypothetical protein
LTAAVIIGAVLLVLIILLQSSVRMIVDYRGGKLRFEVKYLFLTLFPFKKRKKKKRRKKKKKTAAPAENSIISPLPQTEADSEPDTQTGGGKTKRSAAEIIEIAKSTIEKVKRIYGSSERGIKHVLAKLAVEDLFINIKIGTDDAAKTGTYYGWVSAAVYNAIGFLRPLTTLYIKDIEIIPDFEGNDSVFDISFAVTVTVRRLLSSGLLIGWGFWRDRKKYRTNKQEDK